MAVLHASVFHVNFLCLLIIDEANLDKVHKISLRVTYTRKFFPTGFAGDAHFDDDEIFTLRTAQGTNFYWVALHEFGHSLGLEHSNKREAIMYPWYQGYKGDDVDLRSDDILGIQTLYGKVS